MLSGDVNVTTWYASFFNCSRRSVLQLVTSPLTTACAGQSQSLSALYDFISPRLTLYLSRILCLKSFCMYVPVSNVLP